MTGRVGTVWNVLTALPAALLLVTGRHLSWFLTGASSDGGARVLFLVGALAALLVDGLALLKPASVYGRVTREGVLGFRPMEDPRRLANVRPLYPALAIWLLWSLSPGCVPAAVPPAEFAWCGRLAVGCLECGLHGSFAPTLLLFAYLCQRVPLRHFLWWGTIIAVPHFLLSSLLTLLARLSS